jgi:hypothetical protein
MVLAFLLEIDIMRYYYQRLTFATFFMRNI